MSGRVPKPAKSGKARGADKRIVVGLVERGGNARMFHLNNATVPSVRDVLVRNADRVPSYRRIGEADHA